MKTATLLFCGLCLVITVTALADPYVISKQQAHRAADQASSDPQNPPPPPGLPARGRYAAPPTAAAPSAAPVDPALAATLQNINDLRADLDALNAVTNGEPAAVQKVSLLNHLSAAASGTKPSSASVQKLADHVVAATTSRKTPAAQQTNLARYLHAACNGSHLTAAQLTMILGDAQKIMTTAGASADDAGSVVADLKAIAAESK